ncbi:MAG: BglG family transcription antiterminator [Pelolinea sp.]|nr:BglG family transcription antiterminator [Pelolinea sp.]
MVARKPDINFRQQNIILELLSANGKITLAELAEKTGLNTRVIRYNMDIARAWLRVPGIEFINKPGYGFEVVASQQIKNDLLATLNTMEDCDLVLSSKQRIRLMLLYLLTSIEPVAAKMIAEMENFSRSTIFKDILGVEKWLDGYNIQLLKRSARGLWIECREESRRFALVRLIREELGDTRWHRLFAYFEDHHHFSNDAISHRIAEYIDQLRLDYSHQLIRYIEENINRCMSLKSQVEIMAYLGIMIQAIKQGRSIKGNVDTNTSATDEYAVAQVIGYQIEKEFQIKPSPKEIELLTALIIGSRWEDSPSQEDDRTITIPSSIKSDQIAQQMINICSMRLHPMLKIDEILFQELKNHLDYSLFRLNYHIPIRNSNLEIIKDKFPKIYLVAESSIFLLENEVPTPIPEEEIGFIAMYLLSALERLQTIEDPNLNVIIANDGVRAKSSLLQARLGYEFPNLRVTNTINSSDTTSLSDLIGDLIISTLPLENSNLPVIEVQPFLEIDDIKTIQRWIAENNQTKRRYNMRSLDQQNSLVDLIKLSNITFTPRVSSWWEMVVLASKPLINSLAIQECYLSAMVKLIEDHGFYMYMGSGVLLLHAKPTDGVNQLCMSMLKLQHPFKFDKGTPPDTDIIFVLGATNDNSHLTALFQLNELIQYPDFMTSIRDTKRPSEVVNILWQWIPKLSVSV